MKPLVAIAFLALVSTACTTADVAEWRSTIIIGIVTLVGMVLVASQEVKQ